MLDFDDSRWPSFAAGYRVPIDLRPLLRRLESGKDKPAVWADLWTELHHQGDIGIGSFVAVPHLVRIHRLHGVADWNTYALVATIEVERGHNRNPDVPEWCRDDYHTALHSLAEMGLKDFPQATDKSTVRAILSLLAIVAGARAYGRILLEFDEDEVLDLLKQAFGDAGTDDAK